MKFKNRITAALKQFATYSRSERNGTIVLGVLLLLLIVSTTLLRGLFTRTSEVNTATVEKIDSFFNSLKHSGSEPTLSNHSAAVEELTAARTVQEFYFNPNTVTLDSLIDLGLSPKQAQVVVNYRSKGGRFRTPDDLSKIHVIDSATFQRLRSWVRIPQNLPVNGNSTSVTAPVQVKVDLNSADSVALTKLKGIGPGFARRIIAYRNMLGGFYSTAQLSEVYGITPELIAAIEHNVWVDSTTIRSVNINMATYEHLKNHPYITDYQAKAIVYYRSKRGTIVCEDELLQNKLLPQDRFYKLKPYLTVK
ncbi:MAG: helix-hairpin-helix domain-containing protein [Bacteroidales bacterium]|nr:helix-hairpin-helix domain-containing protein [Bacteroidales bacterium]